MVKIEKTDEPKKKLLRISWLCRHLKFQLRNVTLNSDFEVPTVMYFHPWEFDSDQPRIKLPLFKRFRHYVGLKQNKNKFLRLLDDFEFTTIEKLISTAKKDNQVSNYKFNN